MSEKKSSAYTKTALTLAIAAATAATGVSAQEAAIGLALEEIVVTGVRGSLSQSLDVKRDANAIVDSIRAEELGRFPDDNVADSLAHIPGITVSRNRGGEAEYINIRGLGPEFSVVTLNNRILATDDIGRNLAFDVLPSEMISGADVWKTVEAKNVEGSIGGAVNLQSIRPLDRPGMQGTVSLKGDHNSLSGETGNKLTGVFSNTFADDTFGFVVGLTRESGDKRADEMFDNFFFGAYDDDNNFYDLDDNGTIEEDEMNLVMPGSYALGAYATDFERTGLTSTFQWRPSDRVELTADVLITELEADTSGYTESFYMVAYPGRWSNIVIDQDNVITAMDVENVTMEVVTLDEHRTVDTAMFGLNGQFQVTDSLTLSGDIYRSSSERDGGGKDTFVVAGSPGDHSGHFELNEGGLPDYIPTWTEGRTSDDFGNDDFSPHWSERFGDDVEDVVTGMTLEGELELDIASMTSLQFGVSMTDREKTKEAYNNSSNGGACNYCGYPFIFGDVDADVVRPFPFDNLLAGESADVPRSFPIFDIQGYADGLAAADGQTLTNYNGDERTFGENESAIWAPVYNPVDSYDISEDTTTLFVQGNFEGDSWYANAGVRWVDTEVAASYSYNEILSIEVVGDPNVPNPEWDVTYSDSADQTANGGYTKLLPAVNFGMWLTDDVLVRAAAAKSMSRPTIDQLAPLTSDNAMSGVFDMTITGNPDIEPVFSKQYDLGMEWYFADDSILYGAVFRKDLDGFITDNTRLETIAGQQFRVTQPINGDTAEVTGIELGVQKFFDNGFGVTASYGHTSSDTVVDGEDAGALVGLADNSYSLSLIYEKDKISAQITLDYTSDLVADAFSVLDSEDDDSYEVITEEVSMVTAAFRYDITDQAQLFVEGVNLLDESNRTFARSDLPTQIQVYGRTFNFGARYSF